MRTKTYDVVVVGGGTAGVVAAVQAGRAGARTLLVEKHGMLGGAMTVGGINYPASFFAEGRPIIAGIGWELVRRTLEETGQALPDPKNTPCHILIDAVIFAALADEAVLQAGVEPLFHALPASASLTDKGWKLQLCTKTGLRSVRTRVLVDATGDANVVRLAGFETLGADIVQPATLSFGCSGYDPNTLDYEALKAAADAAVAAGEILRTDVSWREDGPRTLLMNRGHNSNHIRAPNAETSEGRTLVEIEGRRSLLRLYRFLRRQPGLEGFRFDWVCPETAVRETVRIRGKTIITVSDYESGRQFPDAVCYAYYPIDEHLNDGRGINARPLRPGVLPTIPRSALLPEGSRYLIAAGRCVSSDREANSALRVEAPCMAMGQAAGAIATLSAKTGLDPEEVPMEDLRVLLRTHGAIVPSGDLGSHLYM